MPYLTTDKVGFCHLTQQSHNTPIEFSFYKPALLCCPTPYWF